MRKCVFLAVTHRDVEHRFPCPGRAHIRRAPRKIVVVDDNLYAAEAMKTLLQLHSHAVTLASNADQALRDARLEMPDVFLVDIGLPGKSGHKLTTELGQLPCKKPLRIIAMTGFGQPEDRRRSLAAGFDDHMVKPVTLNALLKCLGGGANPMK